MDKCQSSDSLNIEASMSTATWPEVDFVLLADCMMAVRKVEAVQ